MSSRFFAFGILAVTVSLAAVAAVSTFRHPPLRPSALSGNARLHAFGSRGTGQHQGSAQAKFDGALGDLSRHASSARPDHALLDLRSMAPAVRFKQSSAGAAPLVLIDAVTRGDPQVLKAALVSLGLQHPSVYSNDVGGWLPVTALQSAAARAEVHSIRAAMWRTRSGAVTSQGDFAQHSDVVRSANSLTGAGITVGVISDSYDCYSVYAASGVPASGTTGYAYNGFLATAATDVSTGDLPSNVNVVEEAENGHDGSGGCMNYGAPTQLPFSDEGRAMLQIVHDVAPGAGLAFYTAENSEADFANGIGTLADAVSNGGAGAKIIADDIGYFDEPFFQDGIVAQAIDTAAANGVAYFSAAGNNGSLAYDNLAPDFSSVSTTAPNSGEKLLNFDTSGATTATSLSVTVPALFPGQFLAIMVAWDQPYVTGAPTSGGATSHIDLCVTGVTGNDEVEGYGANPVISGTVTCSGPNASGVDPYQILIIGNPANAAGNTAAETFGIVVGLADGTAAPGRIKVVVEDDGAGSTIDATLATNSATLQGHPGAAGAVAVGAAFYVNTPACGTTPAGLEDFSARGGDPILFDVSGSRLATPEVRQKPDLVGPDGVNDTFLGYQPPSSMFVTTPAGCANNAGYPNFFGTSAATPHVASIAALMLQANPALTPAQIYTALRSSALPMATPSPNVDEGYGFVQADAAFAAMPQVVPAAPTLTLSSSSITVGGSTTITWSSVNATGCTASGSWSGALAANGSQSLTPAAAGTDTYTLKCANATGASAATSDDLMVGEVVANPPPAHSGGGGLDMLALAGLASIGIARFFRMRRRVLI
jgi:hypothetical protein